MHVFYTKTSFFTFFNNIKNGLDVLDFRGCQSRVTFASLFNIIKISKLPNIKSEIIEVAKEIIETTKDNQRKGVQNHER
ncbi:hypothetical protein [Fusobacterium sp.]|uniref:hypothetical protein n=1 Tax=Fusobacterium sp. TaxID=68766 RepID=UPI002624E791|nr:hypothetical protein [Fusobacterium sp.]